jgi:lysosomal Pro-X carboxypeptidase
MGSGAYGSMAMVNYPYPTDFLASLPAWPVQVSCSKFENLTSNATEKEMLTAFHESWKFFYGESSSELKSALDSSGWNYMACNEMIMPIYQNGISDMFWPDYFNSTQKMIDCESSYSIVPQFDWALDYFGGRKPTTDFRHVHNIIFSNGDLDPWGVGGVIANLTNMEETNTIALHIADSAHHLDMRLPHKEDPASVTQAREIEMAYIQKFIDDVPKAAKME